MYKALTEREDRISSGGNRKTKERGKKIENNEKDNSKNVR
jgi:hypothetical protein